MLPKNKLRDRRLERLRIFEDDDMGVFKDNIVKRWDGQVSGGTLEKAASSS